MRWQISVGFKRNELVIAWIQKIYGLNLISNCSISYTLGTLDTLPISFITCLTDSVVLPMTNFNLNSKKRLLLRCIYFLPNVHFSVSLSSHAYHFKGTNRVLSPYNTVNWHSAIFYLLLGQTIWIIDFINLVTYTFCSMLSFSSTLKYSGVRNDVIIYKSECNVSCIYKWRNFNSYSFIWYIQIVILIHMWSGYASGKV